MKLNELNHRVSAACKETFYPRPSRVRWYKLAPTPC